MKKNQKPDDELIDRVMAKPRDLIGAMQSKKNDPNGSYTGLPANRSEKPAQDADDL